MPRRAGMSVERSRRIARNLTENPEYRDFIGFAKKYLRVQNRREAGDGTGRPGENVRLVLNPVQMDFVGRILRARAAGRPGRFIVLKARRMGISTAVEALYFWDCLTNANRRATIIAHEDGSTRTIFAMARRMYEHLPMVSGDLVVTPEDAEEFVDGGMPQEDLRPAVRYDNKDELWLTHATDESAGLNSLYTVATAANVEVGRSPEIHLLHGSEVAFWPDPGRLLGGLYPAMSDDPETCVVLESTAAGAGGFFYEEFWRHYAHHDTDRGLPDDWEAVFYPWFAMPGYRRQLTVPEADFRSICPDPLLAMIEEYGLDLEQANWALGIVTNKCHGDWGLFRQEFPGKPEEAFAYSTSRKFPEADVAAIEAEWMRDPDIIGDIRDSEVEDPEEDVQPSIAAEMEPTVVVSALGPLWIWEPPVAGATYIVAADPASGTTSGDFCGIQVLDDETGDQVAEWWGKEPTMRFARRMVLLALFYNQGLLSWEVTGGGRAVSLAVRQLGYWNVYEREQVDSDHGGDGRWGWDTNIATKPQMVEHGLELILSRCVAIRSARLFKEIRGYREIVGASTGQGGVDAGEEHHRRIRWGAPSGGNDDLAMSWLQGQTIRAMGGQADSADRVGRILRSQKDPIQALKDGAIRRMAEQKAADARAWKPTPQQLGAWR